jgi:hypothetical protein
LAHACGLAIELSESRYGEIAVWQVRRVHYSGGMAEGEIEIDTAHLAAAGECCGHAAASMRKAADELAGAQVGSGIFGRFAQAQAFHAKLSAAHQSHAERLEGHHAALRGLSARASFAARTFADTDESAGDELSAAGEAMA